MTVFPYPYLGHGTGIPVGAATLNCSAWFSKPLDAEAMSEIRRNGAPGHATFQCITASLVRFDTAPLGGAWDPQSQPAPQLHKAISLWAVRVHKRNALAFFVKGSTPLVPISNWHQWSRDIMWERVITPIEQEIAAMQSSGQLLAIAQTLDDALSVSLGSTSVATLTEQRCYRLIELLSQIPVSRYLAASSTALVTLLAILSEKQREELVAKINPQLLLRGCRFNPDALEMLEPARFLRSLLTRISVTEEDAADLSYIVGLFRGSEHGPGIARVYMEQCKGVGGHASLSEDLCQRVLSGKEVAQQRNSMGSLLPESIQQANGWCRPCASPSSPDHPQT